LKLFNGLRKFGTFISSIYDALIQSPILSPGRLEKGFNTAGSTESVQFCTDAEAAVGRQHLATLIVVAPQHFPRCGVHKVNLPANDAGHGFVAPVVRRNFFCREALHVEAGVWAAVDERGHTVLCRISAAGQLRSVWGASFRGESKAGTGIQHSLDSRMAGPDNCNFV
jgi:hypothetical protein